MKLGYEELKKEIHIKLGIDLHAYKEQQMRRRINQWVDRHNLVSYTRLLEKIDQNSEHRKQFVKYLTINTSHFFRDANVFTTIEKEIIPAISKNKRPRIWSAGASIGAEIYSIAILLAEMRVKPRLLLATDLDQVILNKAVKGVYQPNQIQNLEKRFKDKYFTILENGNAAIKDSIKNSVVFKKHDLLKDPYQTNFDLILCRNVFIYFTSETQKRLIKNFMQSLNPNGFFVVGSAEQIMDPQAFGLKRVGYCVYQKSA
ncbi:MAG: protein-glutamate O-methyltransferase CheR [Firmicutes bacterium]|nr:protein-glutamate O-methyltransferase CheR [Bacillota bacterium]